MRQRKYRRGEPFHDIEGLVSWLETGGWVYWGERPKHPGFIWGMTLKTVVGAVKNETLVWAIRNEPPAP